MGNTGPVYGGGLAFYVTNPETILLVPGQPTLSASVRECAVKGNAATFGAGAFAGDGVYLDIDYCTLRDNTAGADGGGALLRRNRASRVANTLIEENEAVFGAGLWLGDDSFFNTPTTVTNCLVVSNKAPGGEGGGLYVLDAWPLLEFCTLSLNEAALGAGLRVATQPTLPPVELVHGVLWNDFTAPPAPNVWEEEISQTPAGSVAVLFTDWRGSSLPGAPAGVGLLDADPLFVTGGTSCAFFQPNQDYHLLQDLPPGLPESPCLDAGDPAALVPAGGFGTTNANGTPDTAPPDLGFHYCAPVLPPPRTTTLTAAQSTVSLAGGVSSFDFTIDAGEFLPATPANSRLYFVFGSASGSNPMTPFEGILVPLAYDAYTVQEFTLNVPPPVGPLPDPPGVIMGSLCLPVPLLPPGASGSHLHHVALILELDPAGPAIASADASQAVKTLITP